MAKITILQLLDPLKVFLEFDTEYGIYVAQCLQTGHLVTADDPDMATEMITELLGDEVSIAIAKDDLGRLLSNPAPINVWAKYEMASQAKEPEPIIIRIKELSDQLRLLVGQAEVETEIKIATGRTAKAA